MSEYMVRTKHPNNWTGDGYRSLDCREEAEDYAKARAYGTPDQEDYVLATPFVTLETHDRLIREAKAEALTAAADDIVAQFGTKTVMGYSNVEDVEFPTWLRDLDQQLKEES